MITCLRLPSSAAIDDYCLPQAKVVGYIGPKYVGSQNKRIQNDSEETKSSLDLVRNNPALGCQGPESLVSSNPSCEASSPSMTAQFCQGL
jgi:hypothetical protein